MEQASLSEPGKDEEKAYREGEKERKKVVY